MLNYNLEEIEKCRNCFHVIEYDERKCIDIEILNKFHYPVEKEDTLDYLYYKNENSEEYLSLSEEEKERNEEIVSLYCLEILSQDKNIISTLEIDKKMDELYISSLCDCLEDLGIIESFIDDDGEVRVSLKKDIKNEND